MKIAVVGGGVSGLVCAYLLHRDHDVTLFEANDYAGGHTRTARFELGGRSYGIDTGYCVYSPGAYPSFSRLLARLGIRSVESPFSFSVSCERSGIEYSTRSVSGLLSQRRNLVRPAFLRMVLDIARFGQDARQILDGADDTTTLAEHLRRQGYSRELIDLHLLPAAAALWSSRPERVHAFPARWFVEYFRRHGFLGLRRGLSWHHIPGGNDRYVQVMLQTLGDRVRLSAPVRSIRRSPQQVTLETHAGGTQIFDQVIVATHGDQVLPMLGEASEREREIFGAFSYDPTEVILHTDTSLLPNSRRAWSAWNTRILAGPQERIAITYNMNRVQDLRAPHVFCVTLFGRDRIDPARILGTFPYRHPASTPRALVAQRRHSEVSGVNRTHYCGAYWGFGFHEDAVRSALAVCQHFGKNL